VEVLFRTSRRWLRQYSLASDRWVKQDYCFYPPIAVDQKDRLGRGSRYKSRNSRVASASSVLGEECPGWRRGSSGSLQVLHFFFLRQLVHLWWSWQTIGCPNSRLSFVYFCILKFWGVRVCGKWRMVFLFLRRQSGGKYQGAYSWKQGILKRNVDRMWQKKLAMAGLCHILQVFLLIIPFPRFKNTHPGVQS